MFGRQEMGEGSEAVARRQVGNESLDGHGGASGGGLPAVAVADRQQFDLEADFVARSGWPQRIEFRQGNFARRLQGHSFDADRLLAAAGEQAEVVVAEHLPAAMAPGGGDCGHGQE